MPSPILISVAGGTPPSPSMPYAFRYRILKASDLSDKGGLRGVTNEPTFKGVLNSGSAQLQLTLDHYPSELTFGDVVRVNYPDGEIAGMWRYEKRASKLAAGSPSYTIDLFPLAGELTDADFTANYTVDTTQPTAPLGTVTFDVPIKAAAARTLHVKPGIVNNDGTAYSYSYNLSKCSDTLSQAMLFGGAGWWWYVDALGVLSFRNTSPFTHDLLVGTEISAGEWDDDIVSLFNGQPVTGGRPANALTALTAFAQDTNPASPYSVPSLGRRTNSVYSDSSLLDQASVNAVAANLLAFNERVSSLRKVKLLNYRTRRPQPGDAVLLREPADPGQPVSGSNPITVDGPFLIVDVTEYGATYTFELTINASMVVPLSAFNPNMESDQAVAKLMQNQQSTAISPSGAVGSIGSGVLGGLSSGGTVFNAVPTVPVGVFATTGIDLVAQTNNAWVNLTWSSPNALDVVVRYDVQWRKSTDADVPASYYHLTTTTNGGLKIGSLIQGVGYTFQVRAINDTGVASAWSAGYGITVAIDASAPAVPTGLTAYRTARGALVSWNGTASSAAGDLQGYMLQVNINGDGRGFRAVNQSPYLGTSYQYVAPKTDANGVALVQGTVLVFQLAAVDWTGNQSAWTSASTNVLTDGVIFDDIMTGSLTAVGTIQGGSIQTGSTGARVLLDANGVTLYDGTATDRGKGPGVTAKLASVDGSAFFSGTVSASTVQSSTLQGPSGAAGGSGDRMWLDLIDTAAGVGPLLDVNYGSVDRVQIGNLAALGVSPAQYGIRVNDASGAPVFDSLGLIAAATQIGHNSGSANVTLGTSNAQLAATNTSFTLTRQVTVLILACCTVNGSAPGSNQIDGWIGAGVAGTTTGVMQHTAYYEGGTSSYSFSMPLTALTTVVLGAGSYTACLFGYGGAGIRSVVNPWEIFVIQLGS